MEINRWIIKMSINQPVNQSINLRFRTIIFEFNLGGIYEAELLSSDRFSNAELIVYCNNFRDLLPMRKSYTESKLFHQNVVDNELTSKCVHTYKRHAVCISVKYWTALELYGTMTSLIIAWSTASVCIIYIIMVWVTGSDIGKKNAEWCKLKIFLSNWKKMYKW